MAQPKRESGQPALSKEFAARLNQLGAKQLVRALVLLQTGVPGAAPRRPAARQGRQQKIEQLRAAARVALPEVDQILAHHEGKRLSDEVDALGSIVVETTAAGIRALATSAQVKAILEDQGIFQTETHAHSG